MISGALVSTAERAGGDHVELAGEHADGDHVELAPTPSALPAAWRSRAYELGSDRGTAPGERRAPRARRLRVARSTWPLPPSRGGELADSPAAPRLGRALALVASVAAARSR